MQNKEKPIEASLPQKKDSIFSSILQKIGRIISVLFLLITVSGLGLYFYVQTDSFRNWLKPILIDGINSSIDGKVDFEDIRIDIFKGIVFHNAVLMSAGDTVLKTTDIAVFYHLDALFSKSISLTSITLDSPSFKIIRHSDSTWNIDHFLKPQIQDPNKPPFDWHIYVGLLELCNGSILIKDSLSKPSNGTVFNAQDALFEQVNVLLSGQYFPGIHKIEAHIRDISFNEINSKWIVNHLSMNAKTDFSGCTLTDLTLQTPISTIMADVHIQDIDILSSVSPEEISKAPITLSLKAKPFNPDDLRKFLPHIGFYGSYDVQLEAEGNLHEIHIAKLFVKNEHSSLNIKGMVTNIDKPEKLRFEAQGIGNSSIVYDELKRNTPVLQLPILDFLGTVQFSRFSIIGMPSDSISMNLKAHTASGSVDGLLSLYFHSDTLAYDGDIQFSECNLGKVIHNPNVESALNMHVQMKGKGTDLPSMKSSIKLQAGASKIGNYAFQGLLLSGNADYGLLNIDTANIILRDHSPEASEFDELQYSSFSCNGFIDLRQINPSFSLETNLQNVELASLFDTKNLPTIFDGSMTLVGKGMHIDSIEGSAHIHARQIIFEDRTINPQMINVDIHRYANDKRLTTIESKLYNIKAEGIYRFEPLIAAISQTVSSVIIEGEKKYNGIKGEKNSIKTLMPEMDTNLLDVKLLVKAKDFSPLNLFLQGIQISGEGELRASIQSTPQKTDFNIDSLSVKNGHIFGPDNNAQSSPFLLYGSITTIPDTNNRRIISSMKIHSECSDDLFINNVRIHQPELSFTLKGTELQSSISADMGELFSGVFASKAELTDTSFAFESNTCLFTYGPFTWHSVNNISGRLSASGLEIFSLVVQRDSAITRLKQRELLGPAETISVKGLISSTAFSGFSVDISGMPLKDIQQLPIIPVDLKDVLRTLKGTLTQAGITADGSFTNPTYQCKGTIKNIVYNDVIVGNQTFDLHHKDSIISGSVIIINPKYPNQKALDIGIEQIPYNLAVSNVGKPLREDEEFVVTARAKSLSIATIAPFIPGISKLQGNVDAEISLGGFAPNKINYGGQAHFNDVNFILDATNIKYFAGGRLLLKNATATLDSIILKNDKLDLPTSEAIIKGNLQLKDIINIDNFDLSIVSKQLLVLSDASASTMPLMYGKFIIASGQKPLHFTGSFTKPKLRGDVKVLQASITMPPEQEQTIASGVRYTVLNNEQLQQLHEPAQNPLSDFLKILSSTQTSRNQKQQLLDSSSIEKTNENETENLLIKRSGFNDLLDYDLEVYMPGKFFLKMILGTFEEIRANIEPVNKLTPLYFRKERFKQPQLIGEMRLLEGSEYKFLKVFQATGKLIFNTGELSNPALDLLAVYKGQTRYDNDLENFRVIMKITGTKNLPNVIITWERNGLEATGDSSQIRSDALMKLIVGRTQQELFGKSGTIGTKGIGNEISNSLSAAASQLFSGLLEGTGLLTNATISLQEGLADLSQARLNLSGQLFSDVAWRAAGTLGDLTGNYEFSVDVPITILGDYDALRNLLLQLTRASAPANAITTRQQKEWEMKISWRYAF